MSEQIWDDEELNISFELDQDLVVNKPNETLSFDNVLRSKHLSNVLVIYLNPRPQFYFNRDLFEIIIILNVGSFDKSSSTLTAILNFQS